MLKLVIGNIFNTDCDCLAIPVKDDLVLEGNLGGQAKEFLPEEALLDIKHLAHISYTGATKVSTYKYRNPKAIILVANTWNDEKEKETAFQCLVESYSSALQEAIDYHYNSIAIPALSTGKYNFSVNRSFKALLEAYETFKDFIDVTFYLTKKEKYLEHQKLFDTYVSKDSDGAIYLEEFNDFDYTVRDNREFSKRWFENNSYALGLDEVDSFSKMINSLVGKGSNRTILLCEIYDKVCDRSTFYRYLAGKVERMDLDILVGFAINMGLDVEQTNKLLSLIGKNLDKYTTYNTLVKKILKNKIDDRAYINNEFIKKGLKPIFDIEE